MLMSMGKYEQAVEEAKATVEDFPYEEQNYVALAELYAMLGLDSLAQRTYDEALALNPGSTPTIISLNEFYKQRKDNVRFLATAELLFRAPELPLETKLKFYDDLIRTPLFYRDNYFQIGKLASALAIAYPHDRRDEGALCPALDRGRPIWRRLSNCTRQESTIRKDGARR